MAQSSRPAPTRPLNDLRRRGHPRLDFFGDGRGCNTLTGRFDVLEIVLFDAFVEEFRRSTHRCGRRVFQVVPRQREASLFLYSVPERPSPALLLHGEYLAVGADRIGPETGNASFYNRFVFLSRSLGPVAGRKLR